MLLRRGWFLANDAATTVNGTGILQRINTTKDRQRVTTLFLVSPQSLIIISPAYPSDNRFQVANTAAVESDFFCVAASFFSQKTSIYMVSDNGGGQPTRCDYIRPQHQQ
jgi:hypothetical protein